MVAVRSLLFAVLFYSATLLWVLAGIVATLFGRRPTLAVVLSWVGVHRWLTRYVLGIVTDIEGMIPDGPHLIAVKHQAMYETLEIVLMLDQPAMVMKRELTRIPLWGWVVRRYGVIAVDRGAGASALRAMMRAGAAALAEGRAIIIFPEGTRVPPGEAPPLQPGFAGLYRALGLPVAPVAVDSGRLWPRHRLVKQPGVVTMRFGAPIPPGLDREAVESAVHAAINALEPHA